MNNLYQFAATSTYSCGLYGSSTYNDSSCSGDGSLSYTGSDFFVPLTIGIVLVIASAVFFVKTLRSNHKRSQE